MVTWKSRRSLARWPRERSDVERPQAEETLLARAVGRPAKSMKVWPNMMTELTPSCPYWGRLEGSWSAGGLGMGGLGGARGEEGGDAVVMGLGHMRGPNL